MNILVGISHPKHVYIFKSIISKLKEDNHRVTVIITDKEITSELLDKFNIEYVSLGENKKGLLRKISQSVFLTYQTLKLSRKFKIDIFLGVGFIHFALSSFFLHKPFIFVEDTEVAKNLQKLLLPFTNTFITSLGFKNNLSKKQIRINGNLELIYLHPKKFNTELFKKPNEKYVLLRFVSWNAFHDIGHRGISNKAKKELIKEISKFAKVYIASEDTLPVEFKKYQLRISPEKIHEFVYGAELIVGESPTMTTESALLGTPAICISSWACNSLGNFSELYDNDMIYCYHPDKEEDAIIKAVELLSKEGLKIIWRKKAKQFVESRIDVTEFMVWFIENYPESHKIMKENPDYQNRFR